MSESNEVANVGVTQEDKVRLGHVGMFAEEYDRISRGMYRGDQASRDATQEAQLVEFFRYVDVYHGGFNENDFEEQTLRKHLAQQILSGRFSVPQAEMALLGYRKEKRRDEQWLTYLDVSAKSAAAAAASWAKLADSIERFVARVEKDSE